MKMQNGPKKLFIYAIIVASSLFSCSKKFYQVWSTESINTPEVQGKYTFENDTIRVRYDFWKQNGIMSYEVFNKSDKPIYIDWKKSSYIVNAVKLDYWQEEERIITSSTYQNYLNTTNLSPTGYGVSVSKGKVIKEERITFIPPKSNYYRTQFRITPQKYNISQESYIFDSLNTPLKFRNFVTYSTNEKFEKEQYINNDFYVSRINNYVNELGSSPTKFYIRGKAKLREISPINYPHHTISLLSGAHSIGGDNGGALGIGISYEYLNKQQRVGINIGSHIFISNREATFGYNRFAAYLGNADMKFYIGKNNGKQFRFFAGPSFVTIYTTDYQEMNNSNGSSYTNKNSLTSGFLCSHVGFSLINKRRIVFNIGVRYGYGYLREHEIITYSNFNPPRNNIDRFKIGEIHSTFGGYLSLGYGF